MSPEQARGQGRRQARRHLGLRLRALRDADGPACLRRRRRVRTRSPRVVEREPDFDALSPCGTGRVRQTLRVCLRKDPKQRVRDIGDVRLVLEGAFEMPAPQTAGAARSGRATVCCGARAAMGWSPRRSSRSWRDLLAWAPWRSAPVLTPRKLLASIGADASLATTCLGASAILSPDGTTLAFVAQQAGQTRLFVRKLDQLQADGARRHRGRGQPVLLPGRPVDGVLRRRQAEEDLGHRRRGDQLCDAPAGRGGTWTDDDTIIFTPSNTPTTSRSCASRRPVGPRRSFGTLSQGAVTQRWPQALPGGKGVLYTEHSSIDEL